jgi:pimeloyl-ACP methyl ester carboxylesterase
VLLHGGGQTRGSWTRSARYFARHGIRAITVDARGHGDSDWSESGDYRAEIVSDDIDQLLDLIGGRMVLVGASMGGIISLIIAANDGDRRIDGLVLADITPRLNRDGVDRIHAFMQGNPEGFASLEQAADAVARYNPLRQRPASNAGLMRNLRKRDGRLFWHWDPRFLDSWHPDRQDLTPLLEQSASILKLPALLVHAAESDVVQDEQVDAFRALMPHAEYYLVPGTSHMVAGDDSSAFSQRILQFLHDVHSVSV